MWTQQNEYLIGHLSKLCLGLKEQENKAASLSLWASKKEGENVWKNKRKYKMNEAWRWIKGNDIWNERCNEEII